MALTRQQLHELARYGAAARIAELQAEIDSIRRVFPDVSGAARGRRRGRPRGRAAAVASQATTKRRRRRRGKLSEAGRAAISAAQKKRWAKIKLAKAGTKK